MEGNENYDPDYENSLLLLSLGSSNLPQKRHGLKSVARLFDLPGMMVFAKKLVLLNPFAR